MLLQDATYWAPSGFSSEGEVFAAPAAIKCRWEECAEAFMNPEGEETVSSAVVYCDRQVKVGGYLFLGTSVAAAPEAVAGAYKIRQRVDVPDLRNITQEHRAML